MGWAKELTVRSFFSLCPGNKEQEYLFARRDIKMQNAFRIAD